MAKGRKTGGRVAGTPNKVTASVKAAAAKHLPEAIKTLATIMTDADAPHAARVAAAKEIIDRAAGKSVQPVEAGDELSKLIVEWLGE